jgi:FixJ family two-component response regulator
LEQTPVISIVDDDEGIRAALRSLIGSLGFVAHTFGSAEEFLRSPHVSATSCLISDVRMPNMNGVELLDYLLDQGQQIPTIFMTAFPDENMRTRAMNAGAVAYLTKPYDVEVLVQHINSALRRQIEN